MDMLLTPHDWPGTAGKSLLPADGARPLDWQGFAARLAAAAACRDAFALARHPVSAAPGSFDPASARRLARFAVEAVEAGCEGDEAQSLHAVNRVDSVEVKPGAAISMGTAGTVQTGDRGLQ